MLIVTSRIFQSLRRPFQQVATYYVKPKEAKGTSMQAWLALIGVSTTVAGGAVYLLGWYCSTCIHNVHNSSTCTKKEHTYTFSYTPTHFPIHLHIFLYTYTFSYTPTHFPIHLHIFLYTCTFTYTPIHLPIHRPQLKHGCACYFILKLPF